ncbi:MAG: hypothetical protein ACRBHB_04410 [Arenicella sp.]
MKLIPVLELEPATYSKIQRKIPDYGDIKGWSSYWAESLSDSGMFDIKPVKAGSWFVELSQISDENLNIILNKELGDFDETDDEISPMLGGYALKVDKSIIILPSCCGDLSNIDDWQDASEYIGEAEKELWIGHPWLLVKGDKDTVEIVQTSEYEEPHDPERITVKRSELKDAIRFAKIELNQFESRLLLLIETRYGSKAKSICSQLVCR